MIVFSILWIFGVLFCGGWWWLWVVARGLFAEVIGVGWWLWCLLVLSWLLHVLVSGPSSAFWRLFVQVATAAAVFLLPSLVCANFSLLSGAFNRHPLSPLSSMSLRPFRSVSGAFGAVWVGWFGLLPGGGW
ncbi:hypothetical protein MtrunA17_Chr3g0096981 [Medicago truncatula]|nr:hypothetical protein MtrunA17_Chr3g0096981 [Medicago truncatula]